MKDTQYFPGPPKSWNGGVMSGGGAPTEGRGVPWPPAHHPLPHAGHQLLGFLGAAPTAHLPWSSTSQKPPPASSGMDLSSRPPAGMDLSRARSPLPNGALNGSSTSVPAAATPKESVSVIAPNPLRPPLPLSEDNSMVVDDDEEDDEDEDCMVIDAPPQPPAAHAVAGHLPPSSHGVPLSTLTTPPAHTAPSIASTPAVPVPGLALPLTHQPLPYSSPNAVRPSSPPAAADPPQPPPPAASTAHASAVIPSQPPPSSNHRPPFLSKAADNVESLLENLFQPQEEPPIPHPVIVPNSLRPPPLTEDKVVAMLEESVTPEKASPTLPIDGPPPRSASASSTTVLSGSSNSHTGASQTSVHSSQPASEGPSSSTVPNVIPPQSSVVSNVVPSAPRPTSSGPPPSKVAAMSNAVSTPKASGPGMPSAKSSQSTKTPTADTTSESTPETFLQVESELARMFAGIEEPSEEPPTPKVTHESQPTSATQATPSAITPARRRGRKAGERRGRPRLSSGPTREKKTVAPPPHKDGSSDGSVVGTRARGPFLRLSGDRLCPTSVVLVNAARDDEEKDRSVDPSKRRVPKIVDGRVKGPGLYSSTLSSKYNSNTLDTSWTCAFCHKRSHCSGGLGGEAAGDLFGPYSVILRPQEKVDGPTDAEVAGAQRLHGSRGRGQSLRAANAVNSLNHRPQKGSGVDELEEVSREVWAHEQCIVWAPGVMMVGPHLVGLDDALSSSLRTKCTDCGEMGASVGCLEHGCKGLVHYGCAVASNWQLDEDTFHAHCPHHRKVKVLTLEMLKTGT